MWALLFLRLVLGCPKFQCNPPNSPYPLSSGICSYFDGNDYYLQGCEETMTCPGALMSSPGIINCALRASNLTLQSRAGDPCYSDYDCEASGLGTNKQCVQGRCKGKGLGGDCRTAGTSECVPGLFCLGGLCVKQRDSGGVCASDYMCKEGYGCNTGKCLPYFSLTTGSTVSDCFNYISFFCQTGSCAKGKCLSLIVNVNFLPQTCESSSDCVGVSLDNPTVSYPGACSCGRNAEGWSFCNPFSGDSPGEEYIAAARGLVASNITEICNAASRFGWSCLRYSQGEAGSRFLVAQKYYGSYAQVLFNDMCVKETYTQDYWSLSSSLSLLLSLLSLL